MTQPPAFAHQDDKSTMKRIYPLIFQTSVPTGRLSFTDPNLQAVTHEVTFVPASSMPDYWEAQNIPPEQLPKEITVSVRDAFVATPGYVLMSADYSQLELRLMAHFSKDSLLLEIFSKGGIDVFKQVAGQWFGGLELFSDGLGLAKLWMLSLAMKEKQQSTFVTVLCTEWDQVLLQKI